MTDPLKRYDTSEYGGMEPHEDGDWYDKDEADTLIAELRAKIEEDLQIKLDQLAKISRQGREIAELRGEVDGLRVAANWVLHAFNDVSKAGGPTQDGEHEAALNALQKAYSAQPAEVCGAECCVNGKIVDGFAPYGKDCPACQGTGQKGET